MQIGGMTTVDSLQPTLSWRNEDANETKYDIAIYTGVEKSVSKAFFGTIDTGQVCYVQGIEVYHREGIEGCSHQVEQPLEANTVYVWSVRTHSGSNVGPWATYDWERGGLKVLFPQYAPGNAAFNLWWSFKTPKR